MNKKKLRRQAKRFKIELDDHRDWAVKASHAILTIRDKRDDYEDALKQVRALISGRTALDANDVKDIDGIMHEVLELE